MTAMARNVIGFPFTTIAVGLPGAGGGSKQFTSPERCHHGTL
jgi:hypothetical protein